MAAPTRILVIKLSALGDFFQALGPMAAIRNHHRQATITLLTTKPFEKMARACGYFDHIWIDERPKFYNIFALWKLRRRLRSAHFERIYDLQNNDRTQIYFLLMQPYAPEWVGAAIGASHRNSSPARTAGKAFAGHQQTLALAGITNVIPDRLDWMQANISRYNLPARYVILVPGSAPTRPEKRWAVEGYAHCARTLIERGLTPVLIGTQAEKFVTGQIAQAAPGTIDLTGQTDLFELATLVRHAAGVIGNDTGPMHLASLVGVPCVMIFSTGRGSNPDRHGPLGNRTQAIASDDLQKVTPDQVLSAFEGLQNGSPP